MGPTGTVVGVCVEQEYLDGDTVCRMQQFVLVVELSGFLKIEIIHSFQP